MSDFLQQQADQRVKQCNELIQGIKVIKLLAWESFQAKTITDIRKKEIKLLFKLAAYRAMFSKSFGTRTCYCHMKGDLYKSYKYVWGMMLSYIDSKKNSVLSMISLHFK